METIKIAGCSISCLLAEQPVEKCKCRCNGSSTHGLLVEKQIRVQCSPAARTRCHEGNEDGECKCACAGLNHGLYKTISEFDDIKITEYVAS